MDVREIRRLDPKRIIVLDTETTGLSKSKDEVLSLTIIDLEGTVLFDELIKPVRRQRWPKAEEINGISPAMVKDKKHLVDYEDFLVELWNRIDLVVGYNVEFDTGFLYASGLALKHVDEFDVMKEFAPVNGEWNGYHQDYRWVKLYQCASHYGIEDFDAHTSLGDTEATRKCFLALMDDPAYLKLKNAEDGMAPFIKSLGKKFLAVYVFSIFGFFVCMATSSASALFYLIVAAACTVYVCSKHKSFSERKW